MVRITFIFGALEILLGIVAFGGTGSSHVTALIPAFFGILMVGAAALAKKENLRKHAMHGAAMLGLLGAIGTVSSLFKIGSVFSGTAERPAAVITQLIFFVMSAVFLTLCVRSFIAARKARESGAV